ncbi:LutC/YkgG family protein [Virgibacillus sp. DJP39]|uniref:LutC/YkgG family protein n=1 Tax=Virgibacillus sp. DJP39 TaxID=3409790 RepID=UPI003BB4FF50
MSKGKIHNREKFLDNIAKSIGRDRVEEVNRPDKQFMPQLKVFEKLSADELLNEFKSACKKIHTNVVETSTASLPDVLGGMVTDHGGGQVIVPEDSLFEEYGLSSFLNQETVYTWDPSCGNENIELAKNANIGITFSDITLAESATVVIFNDKNKARTISLLPTTYIAIIPKSTIVPRITQATQEIDRKIAAGETIASCVNFISGPSNSADIEYNLVVGVHGPVRVSYIVVNDR